MENNQQFGQSENLPQPLLTVMEVALQITYLPQPLLLINAGRVSSKYSGWEMPESSASRSSRLYFTP